MARNYDNDPVGRKDYQAAADKYAGQENVGYREDRFDRNKTDGDVPTLAELEQLMCDELRLEDCSGME